jgi:DNA-directed RNA polymerase subunit L
MNPIVKLTSDADDALSFTLSGVNVSIANAIRRTMLSDIQTVVFRTSPHEESKATILVNTSRLNNEILKQRLSCIPIHITNLKEFDFSKYTMELNVDNISDATLVVTTKDFVVKSADTGKPISEADTKKIFPPDSYTGDYIDFVRLRPRISDEIPGEKIHLTCEFSIGTSKQDGMFSVVSTCAYGFTVDEKEMESKLNKKRKDWKDEGKTEKEIENFESKNWILLEGARIVKKDSFDFIVESIGVYTNTELVTMACDILIQRFKELDEVIENDRLKINISQNTMSNCFDIILENEDYTIGKVIEYFLYTKFFEPLEKGDKSNLLSYCGFKKMHPHDPDSIIRVAYLEPSDRTTIKGHLKECIADAVKVYEKCKSTFSTFEKGGAK